jgi:hypothetical protein
MSKYRQFHWTGALPHQQWASRPMISPAGLETNRFRCNQNVNGARSRKSPRRRAKVPAARFATPFILGLQFLSLACWRVVFDWCSVTAIL